MPTHTFGLVSLYDDLRCRYGEDDAVVVQVKAELDKRLQDGQSTPFVERRLTNSAGKMQSRANWQPKPSAFKDSSRSFLH